MSKTTESFNPFDPADYGVTTEDVAVYLETVLADAGDDPARVAQAVGLKLHFESVA